MASAPMTAGCWNRASRPPATRLRVVSPPASMSRMKKRLKSMRSRLLSSTEAKAIRVARSSPGSSRLRSHTCLA